MSAAFFYIAVSNPKRRNQSNTPTRKHNPYTSFRSSFPKVFALKTVPVRNDRRIQLSRVQFDVITRGEIKSCRKKKCRFDWKTSHTHERDFSRAIYREIQAAKNDWRVHRRLFDSITAVFVGHHLVVTLISDLYFFFFFTKLKEKRY